MQTWRPSRAAAAYAPEKRIVRWQGGQNTVTADTQCKHSTRNASDEVQPAAGTACCVSDGVCPPDLRRPAGCARVQDFLYAAGALQHLHHTHDGTHQTHQSVST